MSNGKRVMLIDAVEWAPVYPRDHSLRNVPSWYLRHFDDLEDVTWDVRHFKELPSSAELAKLDGIIVSGSPRDAWGDDPVNDQMCALVDACLVHSVSFLGVCYGHQILGRALGAPVGRHPEGLQLGPVTMQLTESGQQDPLFAGLDPSFEALSGHADYVAKVPDGAVHLAFGGVTEVQAFRYGTGVYGVQFHPEMNADILRFLWQPRIEDWGDRVPFDLEQRVAAIHDTPVAPRVLRNFVERVV